MVVTSAGALHGMISVLRSRFGVMALFGLVALSVFFLTRLVLALATWSQLGAPLADWAGMLAVGLVHDLAVLSYFSVPFVVYAVLLPRVAWRSRIHYWLTLVVFTACVYGLLFTAVAEWFFWEEFGARFNFISVDYLIYRREVTGNIMESYPVIPILAAIAILSLLTVYGLRQRIRVSLQAETGFRTRLQAAVPLLALPVLAYTIIPDDLMQVSRNRYLSELSGNGLYQFFHAFRHNELDYPTFYARLPERAMSQRLKGLVFQPGEEPEGQGVFDLRRTIHPRGDEQRLNVMLIVVESLSADYMGVFGNGEGLTPNLDRLAGEGLLFTRLYATGTRTVRGLEAISLSIPPTPGRSIVKRTDNAGLYNIGTPFRERGYDTRFLYGGYGYFDNMNDFFAGNGFEVVDRSDLADDEIHFANIWGVADQDLYARAIREADASHAAGRPFLSLIMTTSNHRPYTYPDGVIDIPSGSGYRGAVKYTDHAIGEFIEKASSRPWFQDTLFVIVADHTAGVAGKSSLPVERYRIPLILYAPRHLKPQRVERLASQMDVAPTLLGLLNFEYVSEFFGTDILAMENGRERALLGNYQKLALLRGDRLTVLSPRQRVDEILLTDDADGQQASEPTVQETADVIAYYMGADYVYRHHLNRYPPPVITR